VHPASGARRGGARLHALLLPAVTTTARKTSRAAMALAAIALAGCGGQSSRGGSSGSGGLDTLSCTDEDATGLGVGPDPRGYGTRGSTKAPNGSFVDSCDENGDLIERYCFFDRCFVDDCDDDQDALTEVIECPTGCQDGACLTWCPREGPLLVASAHDYGLILEHDSGQKLMCSVDWSTDAYDCSSPDLVGTTLHADVSSACEPIFRLRLNDLEIGETHECELLCHALP